MWRWACAMALLCAAVIKAESFKRAEMSAAPFVLGSRYGRSSPRMMSPRNDRFFMGSRYGKRSELAVGLRGEPWRGPAGCECPPYAVARTYYKRRPEVVDGASDQD